MFLAYLVVIGSAVKESVEAQFSFVRLPVNIVATTPRSRSSLVMRILLALGAPVEGHAFPAEQRLDRAGGTARCQRFISLARALRHKQHKSNGLKWPLRH